MQQINPSIYRNISKGTAYNLIPVKDTTKIVHENLLMQRGPHQPSYVSDLQYYDE